MRNPYYIIAPRYTRTSAGVRVLYKLCDCINKLGGSAYIFLRPQASHSLACSPMDVAPFLNKKIAQYHYSNNLTPIIIYPETFNVKKFDPPISVRYILNYNELLFQNTPLSVDDYIISYSQNITSNIKKQVITPISTIFLPVSDHIFFAPPVINQPRSGGVFYAGKFKYHFGGKTLPITTGLTEITRDQPNSQSPKEIRDLFQSSELFYCYEDSALALEAMLCGCPTVFIPNKFFKEMLANKELLGLGYAWGTSEQEVLHAKKTVHLVRDRYLELLNHANSEIKDFIEKTQLIAQNKTYEKMFAVNFLSEPSKLKIVQSYYWMIRDSLSDKGLITTLKMIIKRVSSFRLKIFN